MKPFALLFLAAVFLPSWTARAAAEPLDEANRAFAAARYDDAASGYQSILSARGWSAPVLYDLGNAELRAGRPGTALLAYERARLLAPRDPDLLANLQRAREKAGLPGERPLPERFASFFSPDDWAIGGSAALFLGCGLAFAALAGTGAARRIGGAAAFLSLSLAALSAGALALSWPGLHRAVVVVPEATVRLSPFDDAQAAFSPAEGSELAVAGRHGGWLWVRDPAAPERNGWIPEKEASSLLPFGKAPL